MREPDLFRRWLDRRAATRRAASRLCLLAVAGCAAYAAVSLYTM